MSHYQQAFSSSSMEINLCSTQPERIDEIANALGISNPIVISSKTGHENDAPPRKTFGN